MGLALETSRFHRAGVIPVAACATFALLAATGIPVARAVADGAAAARPKPLAAMTTVSGLRKRIAELKRKAGIRETGDIPSAKNPLRAKQSAGPSTGLAAKAPPFSARGRVTPDPKDKAEEAGVDYLEALLYYTHERAYPRDATYCLTGKPDFTRFVAS